MNVTSLEDEISLRDAKRCMALRLHFMFNIMLLVISITLNFFLLSAYYRNKRLRTPASLFVIALTVSNLSGMLIQMPFNLLGSYYCKWVLNETGCDLMGFFISTVGFSGVYIMCAISFERLHATRNSSQFNPKRLSKRKCLIMICGCFLFGMIFGIGPVIGWANFKVGFLCGIDIYDRSWSTVSYRVSLFFFAFVIPVTFIVITSFKILLIIKKFRENNQNALSDQILKKKLNAERNLTVASFVLIAMFLLTWFPYSMLRVFKTYYGSEETNWPLELVSSLLSKSSSFWPPFFFVLTNRNIKETVFTCSASHSHPELSGSQQNSPFLNRAKHAHHSAENIMPPVRL